jgi:hypothetical protein
MQDLFLFLLFQSFLELDYDWNVTIRERTRNPQSAHNRYALRQCMDTLYSFIIFVGRDTLVAVQGVGCVV